MVHSLVPCQALDVAIFRIMEKLDPSQSDARICSMRMLYYSRLEAWRQTLLDRNEDTARKQALQEDEMLARLIQQEEDLFWGESRCRNGALSRTSRTFLVIGQVAVALCAATVSSLALKAFVRRR